MKQLFRSHSSSLQPAEKELGESLRAAVIQNETQHVKALIKRINVDYILDENRKTALYLACQYGHYKIVKILVSNGANPNYRCIDGSTPVLAACHSGDADIVSLLVGAGGDIRLHDNEGRGVKQWVMRQMDEKKSRAVLSFIEELYQQASNGANPADSSRATIQLPKKRRRQSADKRNSICLQNMGFGTLVNWCEGQAGEPSMIPVATETDLVHDRSGISYGNGPNMVMESMCWNHVVPVTVKRLRKTDANSESGSVDELINENNYMLRVRHPNILLLLAVCPMDHFENIILIYERVPRGSLHTILHHEGIKVSTHSLCNIFMQVCDAVSYLHYKDLIHSYITSNAIQVMSSFKSVKLGNFEYMVDSGERDREVVVTRSFPITTTNWLAPEIFTEKAVSKRSDIYGICIVLWEILHGKQPFAELLASEIEFLVMGTGDRILSIDATIVESFYHLLDNGLKCDPKQRSCSIKDIRKCFEDAASKAQVSEPKKKRKQKTGSFDKHCTLGCLRICDQNGDLVEIPSLQSFDGSQLVEQWEWKSPKRTRLVEQEEPLDSSPTQGALMLEAATPKAVVSGAKFHKLKAASRFAKDRPVQKDNKMAGSFIEDAAETELTVGNEDASYAVAEANVEKLKMLEPERGSKGHFLDRTAKETECKDGELLINEETAPAATKAEEEIIPIVENRICAKTKDKDDVKDTDSNNIVIYDNVTASEETKNHVSNHVPAAEGTNFESDIPETSFGILQTQQSTGETVDGKTNFYGLPSCETALKNSQPLDDKRELVATASSGNHVVLSDHELSLPLPVSEEIIVPTIVLAKQMSFTFLDDALSSNELNTNAVSAGNKTLETCEETSNNISGEKSTVKSNIGPDLGEKETSKNGVFAVIRLRRSIESMKRAFFNNSFSTNNSGHQDRRFKPDAKASAEINGSSNVLSQNQQHHVGMTNKSPDDLTLNEQELSTSLCSAEEVLPNLSGALISESAEKLKAFINKPLPPLPHSYIKKKRTNRVTATETEKKQPELTATLNWHWINGRKRMIKPMPEKSYLSKAHFQRWDKSSANMENVMPLALNLDFMTGFKPASHHVPSMVAPHLSKRTHGSVITGISLVYSQSPCRPTRQQEDFLGYRLVRGFWARGQEDQSPRLKESPCLRSLAESLVKEMTVDKEQQVLTESLVKEMTVEKEQQVLTESLVKEMTVDKEQQVLTDLGQKHDVPEAASAMTVSGFPSPDMHNISVISSSAISAQSFSKLPGEENANAVIESTKLNRDEKEDGTEEVMGDHQITASKLSDYSVANLEVQDTQRPDSQLPRMNTKPGQRVVPKLATMKAGTSLTLPASNQVSRLLGEADIMHRFRSDPLLQRDMTIKNGPNSAKILVADKASEESSNMLDEALISHPRTLEGNAEIEKDDSSNAADMGGDTVTGGDEARLFQTKTLLRFQIKQPGSPDSTLTVNSKQTQDEGTSFADQASCLVHSAIADALDEITREFLVSRCLHMVSSVEASGI